MSVVLGIDPSGAPETQVAVSRNMRGWRVVASGDSPLREKPTQVVLSVPSEHLTFRTLSVPFTDKKRAEDVARQELANSLPMPLSEVRWSLCPLGRHQYLAVVSPRTRLDHITEACSTRPDIVDAEPFSYARALAGQDVRDGLVVDFDRERTIFCLVRNARPTFVRVLLRGGEGASRLQGAEQKAWFSHLLTDALLPPLEEEVGIFVTGIEAAQPGLLSVLEETLQRPVRPFPVPAGLSSQSDVGALGAALRSVFPDDGVDLLRHRQPGRPVWITYAIAGLLLILLLTLDLGTRYYYADRKAGKYEAALATLLQQKGIVPPTFEQLQKTVDALPKPATGPAAGLLEVLGTVGDKAKGRGVKLQEVRQTDNGIELDGWALSFKDEEGLQKDLATVYKDIQVLDAHQTQDGRVHFGFRIGGRS